MGREGWDAQFVSSATSCFALVKSRFNVFQRPICPKTSVHFCRSYSPAEVVFGPKAVVVVSVVLVAAVVEVVVVDVVVVVSAAALAGAPGTPGRTVKLQNI